MPQLIPSLNVAPELTVVVMAYNEEEGLNPTLRQLVAEVDRLGLRAEIIVVDDGSTDRTPSVAAQWSEQDPRVRVVTHAPNRGLGGVYRTGFAEARGEWLHFMPADGELPPSNLEVFWQARDQADLVLGVVADGRQPILGWVLSRAERALLRLLFGPFPKFQGLFLVRTELVKSLPLTSQGRGWTICMEMILRAHLRGARLAAAQSHLRPRVAGASKARTLRNIADNLRQVGALRLQLWRESRK